MVFTTNLPWKMCTFFIVSCNFLLWVSIFSSWHRSVWLSISLASEFYIFNWSCSFSNFTESTRFYSWTISCSVCSSIYYIFSYISILKWLAISVTSLSFYSLNSSVMLRIVYLENSYTFFISAYVSWVTSTKSSFKLLSCSPTLFIILYFSLFNFVRNSSWCYWRS